MSALLNHFIVFRHMSGNASKLEEDNICSLHVSLGIPCDKAIICDGPNHPEEVQYCLLAKHFDDINNALLNLIMKHKQKV